MKKTVLLLLVVFSIGFSHAQVNGTGGVRRGGTSMDMRSKMKDRLKTELALSDTETDSVVAIQQSYQYKIRAVKMDTKLDKSAMNASVESCLRLKEKRN